MTTATQIMSKCQPTCREALEQEGYGDRGHDPYNHHGWQMTHIGVNAVNSYRLMSTYRHASVDPQINALLGAFQKPGIDVRAFIP